MQFWLRCLLVFFPLLLLAASPARRKVIIDQDAFGPGGPNLQPLLMVLQDPTVEVLGITVESGDGWQKENVAHTLRMLELVGRTDVPVVAGSTFPLLNSEEGTARWEALYGKLGYKGAWTKTWPEGSAITRAPYHGPEVVPSLVEGSPSTVALPEPAAAFLVRKVKEFPGEVSILALGPLTNLALAARLDEQFARQSKELIVMGGSFNPRPLSHDEFDLQFLYAPRVEFNIRWDPEAAEITFKAGWKSLTLVPLDATTATKVTPELLRRATTSMHPVAKYVATYSQPGFPMWDEVAAGLFLEPAIASRVETMTVGIDCSQGPNYGAMLSWPAGSGPGLGEPTVKVVLSIKVDVLETCFIENLNR